MVFEVVFWLFRGIMWALSGLIGRFRNFEGKPITLGRVINLNATKTYLLFIFYLILHVSFLNPSSHRKTHHRNRSDPSSSSSPVSFNWRRDLMCLTMNLLFKLVYENSSSESIGINMLVSSYDRFPLCQIIDMISLVCFWIDLEIFLFVKNIN